MSTTPPAQRQAASRAKKKAAGFVRITLRFDARTASLLRRLTKNNKSTQATTIALGLHLLEDQELLNQVREWAAAQRAAKAPAEQAQ